MKTILLLLLSFAFVGILRAQFPVPNNSFEHWHRVGNYDSLDFWTTNNTASFSSVVRDSAWKLDSVYSMKILANGEAKTPPFISQGWIVWFFQKCTISGLDTVSVSLLTYNNGVVSDSTTWIETSSSLNGGQLLGMHPGDSMQLVFRGGHNVGTTFNVDLLSLVHESVPNIAAKVQARLAPNPMHEAAMFRFRNPEHAAYRWMLIDALGRTVISKQGITGEEIPIERNGLPTGVYTWELWSEKEAGRATGRLSLD